MRCTQGLIRVGNGRRSIGIWYYSHDGNWVAIMEHSDIKKFIEINGYRTLSELKAQFILSDSDEEILSMNLTFLQKKNGVRKIKFQASMLPHSDLNRTEELYYVPAD
jgi:hypothetical protein